MTAARKVARIVCLAAGVLFLFFFCPAVSFVFNEGSIAGLTAGVLLLLSGIFFPRCLSAFSALWKKKAGKVILSILALLLALIVLYCLIAGTMLLRAAFRAPEGEVDAVVVLGCAVKGDKPSKMLSRRLDAAYAYLSSHPVAICVLSGGQGGGESLSEAKVMFDTLVSRGIDPGRLLLEEKSTNTAENLAYSAALLRKKGGITKIVLVTDSFHQYRAAVFAARHGLSAYAVNSATPFFSLPTYFARELPAPLLFLFGLL